MNNILSAIYLVLCFALMFLGVIITIHFSTWLGLILTVLAGFKFWYQLPQLQD
jgi:hypothetical protein